MRVITTVSALDAGRTSRKAAAGPAWHDRCPMLRRNCMIVATCDVSVGSATASGRPGSYRPSSPPMVTGDRSRR